MPASSETVVRAADGTALSARAFGDPATSRAGVLIVPAMGVDQRYYAAFAGWLAEQGYFAVTFDYRGMGRSRPPEFSRSLRGFPGDVVTWATQDVPAVVDYVAARIEGRPLLWVGHSLGG